MLLRGGSVGNRLLLILDWLLLIDLWLLNGLLNGLLLIDYWLLLVDGLLLVLLRLCFLNIGGSTSGTWHAVSSSLAVSVEVDGRDDKGGDEEQAVVQN